MRGITVNSERVALGGASRIVEWGDARKKSQCMRQGEQVHIDNKIMGVEGNMHDARNQATAIHGIQQGDVDVGFLQETKLTQVIHTQNGVGYGVWATEVEIRN